MARTKQPGSKKAPDGLPTKEQILEFVGESQDRVSKREIARAFGIKGAARADLKQLIREMQDEGTIARGRKRTLRKPGTLPAVTVIEITGQDPDGEFLAAPVRWEDEAPPPSIVLAPAHTGRQPGPPAGVGDRVLARLTPTTEDFDYEARVIRRVGEGATRILGVFRTTPDGGGAITPVEKGARYETNIARGDTGGAEAGELVIAEQLAGPRHGPRRGRVKERLGDLNAPRTISLIAIHEHGIPHEFPPAVMEQADAATPAGLGNRVDLRDVPLVTIDPEDARDFDDAVWAAPDDNENNKGGFVALVAIADVAHYVTPETLLDREALKRGNSVYFPDRVVPMLPERISNNLCSLRPEEDRACLAVRMVFDKDGNKKSHEFMRGLMRSAARLTYAQAQAAAEGRTDEVTAPLRETVIAPLFGAYEALARARAARGLLELDLPEHRIKIGEDGTVVSIDVAERLDAHKLVEEFMIAANVCAAETLVRHKTPLLFRIHEAPSAEKVESLRDFLSSLNMKLPKAQHLEPSHFNKVLQQAAGTEHALMISQVLLRTQSQAFYGPQDLGHFGLSLRRYAHFTSPIRRYADLIVHRGLIRALKAGDDGLTEPEMQQLDAIGDEVSQHERRAMAAERDSTDRYMAAYLSDQIGAVFSGHISGVTRFGLFVRLDDTAADGLIPIRTLGEERFHHDEARHALIGYDTGLTFQLGGRVRVKLMEAAPVSGGLRFELIEGGKKSKQRPRRPATGPRGRGRGRGRGRRH